MLNNFGVDLTLKISNPNEVGKMLNISVSIESIDTKKLLALAKAQAAANPSSEVDMPGLLSALEPHSDNILNALLPALPGIVAALKRYIQNESSRNGVVLSDLKVRV
jgi:hypothetical protein